MLIPPHVRATFMPNPPLKHYPPMRFRRKQKWSGVTEYMSKFETSPPPPRTMQPTPQILKESIHKRKIEQHLQRLHPAIEQFRREQAESSGEYDGMNCYNTLFVGRLAYEVTERKLLREMEAFGPVRDIRLITVRSSDADDMNDKNNNSNKYHANQSGYKQSRGYAFVEYEHEEDMKRAYRAADAMRIEGRPIVVDVERKHTVPNFLPRRLGGGLGGTRLGPPSMNVVRPGRYDPARPDLPPSGGGGTSAPMPMGPPLPHSTSFPIGGGGVGRGMGLERGGGGYGGRGLGGPPGGPPPPAGYYGHAAPPPMNYGGGGTREYDRHGDRKRQRSRSPEQRFGGYNAPSRPRY
jgi:U1 small nuclear ribonucleoprotein 70kDa